jgi:hypothetical protein
VDPRCSPTSRESKSTGTSSIIGSLFFLNVGFLLLFPMSSHHVLTGFPTMLLKFSICSLKMLCKFSLRSPICSQKHLALCHILCPKFYSCDLYRQAKKRRTTIWISSPQINYLFIFGDGPISDAQRKIKLNFGVPTTKINMNSQKASHWIQLLEVLPY